VVIYRKLTTAEHMPGGEEKAFARKRLLARPKEE
jgi:hypothetical protein